MMEKAHRSLVSAGLALFLRTEQQLRSNVFAAWKDEMHITKRAKHITDGVRNMRSKMSGGVMKVGG